jgi:hypothetical protein
VNGPEGHPRYDREWPSVNPIGKDGPQTVSFQLSSVPTSAL